MSSKGEIGRISMQEDFICEAILAPAFAHLKKGNSGPGNGIAGDKEEKMAGAPVDPPLKSDSGEPPYSPSTHASDVK